MIRTSTPSDFPAVLGLGRQMHLEGVFRHVLMDDDKVMAALTACHADGFFFVSAGRDGIDGFLFGLLSELWYSRETVAFDLAFFVQPTRRGGLAAVRLVQEVVAWAKARAASEVSISQSSGVRLEETNRLFTGMGFTYVGGVYKWRFC
jgi:GNAT superfamily N-acetyltransferase